ncbi:hypothetical protein PU630_08195 [Microbacterium horticulturae]|uniref:PilZ domain-containing protein n=1 Tax=Microbacterium horticulturae TaxID=3028316 RepID=A0ABY8C282_9MICO|nr:hypothetical protein [Microbacterium sp. KACC 23027]WEG10504.1 hypothetical protein PU630_08195 [Microbacterium sp. KACC 23027]
MVAGRVCVCRHIIRNATVERDASADAHGTGTFDISTAGLRLAVVDVDGQPGASMPDDVFHDRAGGRRPAHLDVHARPEKPTMKMLLRAADPVPPGGVCHHLREERDRLRRKRGLDVTSEQLTSSVARARR